MDSHFQLLFVIFFNDQDPAHWHIGGTYIVYKINIVTVSKTILEALLKIEKQNTFPLNVPSVAYFQKPLE